MPMMAVDHRGATEPAEQGQGATMEFWQVISWCETEHIPAVARAAEELGFDGLILAEHIYYPREVASRYPYAPDGSSPMSDELEFPDPLIAFAAAAAITTRLRFMTGVYILPLRHPIEVARNVATLDRLSQGRFSLGVGVGWLEEEYDQFSVDFASRGRRMDEAMEVMRQLWKGEPASYQGEFFQHAELQIRPVPTASVPIVGGGLSGAALRRSAQRCDGWYGPGSSLDDLPAVIEQLHSLRTEAGLPWQGYPVIAPLLEPLTAAHVQSLAAMGVTGTVNYPFLFGIGPDSTVAEKEDYMADFAHRIIEPVRASR